MILKIIQKLFKNDSRYVDIVSVDKGYNFNNKENNVKSKGQFLFDQHKN